MAGRDGYGKDKKAAWGLGNQRRFLWGRPAGFLGGDAVGVLGWVIICWWFFVGVGGCPVHCRTPNCHLLDVGKSLLPPLRQPKMSRHSQMSFEGSNGPELRATEMRTPETGGKEISLSEYHWSRDSAEMTTPAVSVSGRRPSLARSRVRTGMAFWAKIGTLDCFLSVLGLVKGLGQGSDTSSFIV